ncbi:MAG: hypothetical protein CFE39_07255 [Comamonadaceae bacterium PBBC2]|nr:MAG: hypothetical protein CFE39_07255 [Comamonadaceae bacterium PBBC2]
MAFGWGFLKQDWRVTGKMQVSTTWSMPCRWKSESDLVLKIRRQSNLRLKNARMFSKKGFLSILEKLLKLFQALLFLIC